MLMSKSEKNPTSGYVLTQDNHEIYYDLYAHGHEKVVILAHGFFNSKQAVLFKDMAKALNDDYDVIVMDFRGHGKSPGPFCWTAKEYRDVEAMLGYAHEHYAKIGLVGFSLGAAVSIIAAARSNPITSLIAVSPPSQFNKIDFHFWKMDAEENIIYNVFKEGRIGKGVYPGNLWLKKIKPLDVVEKIKVPVFFIHGKKDWLIRPWHSERLYQKTKSRKRLEFIENGTHAEYLFRRDRDGIMKLFKEWFELTL